jgi:hypothetical protein
LCPLGDLEVFLNKHPIRLDTSKFMEGFQLLRKRSKTAAQPALARAIGFVLEEAKRKTEPTSLGRIDMELEVSTIPVLVTRGERAGLPRRDKKTAVEISQGGLGWKIMLARLNRYSNYNILTDMRFALDRKTFSPGMGRAGFLAKLELYEQRMVKSRHSSTGFFKISWNAVIAALIQYMPEGYRGHFMAVAGSGKDMTLEFMEIGSAESSGKDTLTPVITIQNKVGLDAQFPTINAIRNMEANRILRPILQRAIDKEFQSQCQVAFERGLLDEPGLEALGFVIS